jgi:hypothetical protein
MNKDPQIQILEALEASMLLLDASRQALLDMQQGELDKDTIATLIADIDTMVPRTELEFSQ